MRTPALLLTLAAAVAATACTRARPAERAEVTEDVRLLRSILSMRSEESLASSKGFYLRLDAGRQRLALMLEGVALDDHAVSGLEWGVPQVLFVDHKLEDAWDLSAFTRGRLEPERARDRLEVVAPPPSAGASPASGAPAPSPPPVPKSAEETVSVPSVYRIAFAEGVSLEIATRGGGGRNRPLSRRLADAARRRWADVEAALGRGEKERVRLRVTLSAEQAASLYRSLPPDVGLVVVGLPVR